MRPQHWSSDAARTDQRRLELAMKLVNSFSMVHRRPPAGLYIGVDSDGPLLMITDELLPEGMSPGVHWEWYEIYKVVMPAPRNVGAAAIAAAAALRWGPLVRVYDLEHSIDEVTWEQKWHYLKGFRP